MYLNINTIGIQAHAVKAKTKDITKLAIINIGSIIKTPRIPTIKKRKK